MKRYLAAGLVRGGVVRYRTGKAHSAGTRDQGALAEKPRSDSFEAGKQPSGDWGARHRGKLGGNFPNCQAGS